MCCSKCKYSVYSPIVYYVGLQITRTTHFIFQNERFPSYFDGICWVCSYHLAMVRALRKNTAGEVNFKKFGHQRKSLFRFREFNLLAGNLFVQYSSHWTKLVLIIYVAVTQLHRLHRCSSSTVEFKGRRLSTRMCSSGSYFSQYVKQR